jgi:hypothetical protein
MRLSACKRLKMTTFCMSSSIRTRRYRLQAEQNPGHVVFPRRPGRHSGSLAEGAHFKVGVFQKDDDVLTVDWDIQTGDGPDCANLVRTLAHTIDSGAQTLVSSGLVGSNRDTAALRTSPDELIN